MARQIVFYSWQSDRPNNTNRGLIQNALERAASAIRKDESLQVEPVIERDTAGVEGAPDIASTVFGKIDTSDVFVADVTLVTSDVADRPSPNPNVLLELGYAVKTLSWNRVILVMNSSFGGPELLPFDLRMRRVLVFAATSDDEVGRRAQREQLQGSLERSLRDIIEKHRPPSSGELVVPAAPWKNVVDAISAEARDRESRARAFGDWFTSQLDAIAPDLNVAEWKDDELVAALELTLPSVSAFFTVARSAADAKDRDVALQLHRIIELLAERTHRPRGFSGSSYDSQFDFWRFVVNEAFVGLVAAFVASDQLEIAMEIIDSPVVIPNLNGAQGLLPMADLCCPIRTLIFRSESKKLDRLSLHADILKERRDKSAQVLSMENYRDGDLFVYCANDLRSAEANRYPEWRPYSVLYGDGAPRFIVAAINKSRAERLARILGLTVQELTGRLRERMNRAVMIYREGYYRATGPLGNFDLNLIGSR